MKKGVEEASGFESSRAGEHSHRQKSSHSGRKDNEGHHGNIHHKGAAPPSSEEQMRVKLPQPNEIFGVVTAQLGGSRLRVNCIDGKERIVRIPGRLKREAWIKNGDVVLVVPWEIDPSKGDVTWRYTKIQVEWLKSRNYLPKDFG